MYTSNIETEKCVSATGTMYCVYCVRYTHDDYILYIAKQVDVGTVLILLELYGGNCGR